MRPRLLLLLVALGALVGCGASTAPPLHATFATAPPPSTPPPSAPPSSAPPPSILWVGARGLEVEGLPAISANGGVIVLGVVGDDGARGHPNLTIVVKDRGDVNRQMLVLLSADLAAAMYDDRGPGPMLTERIRDGNQFLADLHHAHDLRPLTPIRTPSTTEDGRRIKDRASGGEVIVAWQPSHLLIDHAGRIAVDQPTPATWLAPVRPRCTNEAFLGSAWADGARRAVVLQIRYTGTDLCWEPDSQLHVVTW